MRDMEIVMTGTVNQYGRNTLNLASENLKRDREIFMAAVMKV